MPASTVSFEDDIWMIIDGIVRTKEYKSDKDYRHVSQLVNSALRDKFVKEGLIKRGPNRLRKVNKE